MFKTQRVLMVLAIIVCLIETLAMVVDWIQPVQQTLLSSFSSRALPRLLIYWIGGLGCWVVGVNLLKNIPLLGHSLTIGGIYLMLLGNNGGLLGSGNLAHRFVSTILTLVMLIIIAVRLNNKARLTAPNTEKQ